MGALMDFLKCKRCHAERPPSEYSAGKRYLSGCQPWCKPCMREYGKEWYRNNRDRRLEQTADYQKTHPEVSRKAVAKWKKNNPEKARESAKISNRKRYRSEKSVAWRKANKQKLLDAVKRSAIKHLDTVIRYRAANRDRHKERCIQWARAHPDRMKELWARRRRLMEGPCITAREWDEVKDKYGNVCVCCGEGKPLTVDHVIPVSRGGSNLVDNIQPLCRRCNSKKNAKAIDYRPMAKYYFVRPARWGR